MEGIQRIRNCLKASCVLSSLCQNAARLRVSEFRVCQLIRQGRKCTKSPQVGSRPTVPSRNAGIRSFVRSWHQVLSIPLQRLPDLSG
jgi:hypothetical protein